ncbi:acyl-CoA thioesterase FadM [Litoreibacter ponti]|uniref:Acyl-CoA thioesterase FadM n=1 Tax=Litoreibacter ponti TaxID=1510457 RepID=A0A2T6BPQ6_9RHOB|nr:acyl-CoA thioesterase [Litoreibacter ponti]PTX58063.1 acyl-CoA thioesterase FadM [Litoreibacter ponti]
MYPIARFAYQFFVHRNVAPLDPTGTHVSHHICWPWDLDLWNELNNGRTLTLYDMGRLPLAGRVGLIRVLKENRWGLTMAGASVRYRRRVRAFDRIEMHSRAVCWDARFIYLEQSMRVRGEATSHILYRSAVTGSGGIVPPSTVMEKLNADLPTPEIPDWIRAWTEAEALRPWPPF